MSSSECCDRHSRLDPAYLFDAPTQGEAGHDRWLGKLVEGRLVGSPFRLVGNLGLE